MTAPHFVLYNWEDTQGVWLLSNDEQLLGNHLSSELCWSANFLEEPRLYKGINIIMVKVAYGSILILHLYHPFVADLPEQSTQLL